MRNKLGSRGDNVGESSVQPRGEAATVDERGSLVDRDSPRDAV